MKINYKKAKLSLLAVLCCNLLFPQQDSIDVFIKSQMQLRGIPGLQLAVVHKGELVKTANYGWANLQDSVPVSNSTVFPINSITKAFTGVAVLQLVERGKLDLASPVSAYLPNLPAAWQQVTVQQLLSHTSGLPDIVDEEESTLISPLGEAASWEEVLKMPLLFRAGAEFRYNQTNYLLLGRIIDTLSGMPFKEFIVKEQLKPAGMTKTIAAGFGADKDVIANGAAGYAYSKGTLRKTFFSFPPSLQTAAGMSCTATEIGEWVIALQNNRFLNEENLQLLWTPARLENGNIGGFNSLLNGYAAGWPIVARTEHPAAAAVGGGKSAVFVYPYDALSIIVLTNLAGGSPDTFIDELAGFYVPDMKEANGFGFSPAVKSLWKILEKNGYEQAVAETKKLKTTSDFSIGENELNAWGYKLLKKDRKQEAIEIFKLNTALFPNSGNAFDSLGEAYASMGDSKLAIKNYEQALKLNPENENAKEQLKRLSE